MTHSIIQKSKLEGASRLDAEYYQPEYLDVAKKLGKTCSIANLTSDIRYGLYVKPYYPEIGVNFIRALNLLDFWISGKILKIPKHKVLSGYRLKTGDVLIVRSGANTGSVAIIYPKFKEATFGSYSIRLRFDKINPFFAATFLNCKYGALQTKRFQTGMAQPNLNIPNIKQIKIPILPKVQQKKIEQICLQVEKTRKQARALYSRAQNLLLKELDLQNFEQEDSLFNIVKLSKAKKIDRLDAEYFQEKYEKLVLKIKSKNPKTLENFVASHSTGFTFKSKNYQEQGVPLIRINNIKKGYLDLSNTAYLLERNYLMSPKDFAKPGDIVLSMSGSIGMTAIIPNDIPKCSINQRILKFTPQNINKNYLALLLNSIIGQYQLEQIGTGGVQTNISYRDIKNILIPILPKSIQQKIALLIKQSHKARKKSKKLLKQAKQKVEELISNS